MADLVRTFSNGTYAANWRSRLNYIVVASDANANSTYIELRQYVYSTSGAYSQSGSWDGRVYINGGQANRNTPSATISTSEYLMNAYGQWVGHDVNGNLYITVASYCNAPVNELVYGETGWTLPRLALAPTISSAAAGSITQTAATITSGVSSNGHGTSTTMTTYYRVSGVGGYTNAGTGTSASLTGLTPGTTYDFYVTAVNNNGDTATSGVSTFKTQVAAGIIPVLLSVM